MVSRGQTSTELVCPHCGKRGTARWEEREGREQGHDLQRSLVSVSRGFSIKLGSIPAGEPVILCRNCNSPVQS